MMPKNSIFIVCLLLGVSCIACKKRTTSSEHPSTVDSVRTIAQTIMSAAVDLRKFRGEDRQIYSSEIDSLEYRVEDPMLAQKVRRARRLSKLEPSDDEELFLRFLVAVGELRSAFRLNNADSLPAVWSGSFRDSLYSFVSDTVKVADEVRFLERLASESKSIRLRPNPIP